MTTIDITVHSDVSRSPRVQQLSAMFDVPPLEKTQLSWHGELPLEEQPWNVGLIVGPSGSGKTTIATRTFGEPAVFDWAAAAVVDDFPADCSMQDISAVCQAVGFNTIPAWMRPFHVLSNGERFRVDLARRLLTLPSPIVLDEFTSVVDRQVAKIGAYAVQKQIRRTGKQVVAVSCHYDVAEWLQPDWIFEPATMTFTRRSLQQRRPAIECHIARVPYAAWQLFAPFHYMTNELHRAARCFVLYANEDQPASFAGMLFRPHPKARDIMGISRIVTLPDWQGLGLAFVLSDTLASAYKALGYRTHYYPAHPSFIRSVARSKDWKMTNRPGVKATQGGNQAPGRRSFNQVKDWKMSRRMNATFEWIGPAMEQVEAQRLLEMSPRSTRP